ncbi:hypothetical protein DACRYDRAFT_93378 [Dacryopinax primogenitus]|uniref:Uncharacterized protein n=1 Tax=Dacryopinax primogenitus (strain DJM 731) TaxID=1858805 RepID=M5G417_DACPD|nr:uncharacterized protein DACRYDRAFT_93378 [Dacryopinax primogenitus]EJU05006.1 hypothetical protein DACRYDRAFT_93378 [Dacryopinax primogenitus]
MPLFGHRRSTSPSNAAATPTPVNNAPVNDPAYNNTTTTGRTGSIFGRNRRNENVDDINGYNSGNDRYGNGVHLANQIGMASGDDMAEPRCSGSGSFFSRNSRNTSLDSQNIPVSLEHAHAKLDAAVASERAADSALRDARDMVDRIEREARREADVAAAKLKEARTMRKTAGGLGKFGTA